MEPRTSCTFPPFARQELFLADEEGKEILVAVVKSTFSVQPDGSLELAEVQRPVDLAGVFNGDPETASLRFEPENAPLKLATDIVLVGHAHAPNDATRQLDVGIQVGPVRATARVFGDRVWFSSMGFPAISDPLPFDTMPLVFERAFGGWDVSPEDPDRHTVEARNPVGVGFHPSRHSAFVPDAPVPNIEDPRFPIRTYGDTPPPAGFGFTGANWMPRAQYAGTYDEAWFSERMPLLPKDFDRRFYNAAAPGLVAPGYLAGNEPVTVVNATRRGRLQFNLPGWGPPSTTAVTRGGDRLTLDMALDTVIVDTDEEEVVLIWRGHRPLVGGSHSLAELIVRPTPPANGRA